MKTFFLLIFIFSLSFAQAKAPTDKKFLGFCYGKKSDEIAFYSEPNSKKPPVFKSQFYAYGIMKAKENGYTPYLIQFRSEVPAAIYFKENNEFIQLLENLWVAKKDVIIVSFNEFFKEKNFWFKDPKYLYSSPKRTPLNKDLYEIVSKSPQIKGKEAREFDGEFFVLFEKFVRPGCKEEDKMGGSPADSCFITPKEEIWMPLFDEKGHRLFFFRWYDDWIDHHLEDD